ncbi:MAG: hypothetical protein R3362_04095 [Rhodothermales bacterium]|nr:hypothetical protein [Rhodothermales bacterium]
MRLALLLAVALLTAPALAQPLVVSEPEAQEGVAVTVYNGGFSLVREVRPLALQRGPNVVRFEGVAAQIDPTTLALKSLTAPEAVAVREQNYQYDLIGRASVLNAAVGEPIRLRRLFDDGRTEVLEGVLLSQPEQGLIVRLDDGRVLVNPAGEVELAALPTGLVSRPSLLWRLDVGRAGTHRTQVSYLTNGLAWEADYVAVVDAEEDAVDLTGWVTLNNQSGATYRDARLQLMAGDVRRVQDQQLRMRDFDVAMEAAAAQPAFQEEAFFEYHLYTLDGTTTLANRETKQLTLLSAPEAGVVRKLVIDPGGYYTPFFGRNARPGAGGATVEYNAAVVLELQNTEANGMGMPLPAGTVRVYQADRTGTLQFVGEDRINHTARNEPVRLYVGDAFDVIGTRREVENRRISDRVREQTVEVQVRNRKETPAEVTVVERLYGDWTILSHSHAYTELDARTIEFPLTLGPDETVTVRYTVRFQ